MDQGTLLNTISEQRNGALNQVAILQAQLATANKTVSELQAQCDALNKKLQEVSKIRPEPKAATGKKRGRKPKAETVLTNGEAPHDDGHQSAFASE